MNELKKNDIYTVTIDGYTSDALGVCHIDARAVFVPRALMGETWQVKLVKVKPSECYAKPLCLIEAAGERAEPPCPHFGVCGGCDTMHMSYGEELRFKLCKVNDALERIGKQSVKAEHILGSESCLHYRNKGIFAVANLGGAPTFGFYKARSHQLIDIGRCYIQNELSTAAASVVVEFMREHDVPAYDELSGKGCVRHIFVRKAAMGTDAVLCIVAARGFGALTQALVEKLRAECPPLTGIVLNINKSRGNSVLAGTFYTLWGKADVADILCGFRFNIAPQAFFQINPPQAERLYDKAVEYAASGSPGSALDLYCGAGTISLCLARRFGRVIGAEIVPQAIENAAENARANGMDNVEFICADAAQAAITLSQRGLRPDAILVDPPRKGMEAAAVSAVAEMQPERIVYVSCDCATLARDILRFNGFGYTLCEACAVDMFPRTSHVETVALLRRVD